MPDRIAVLKVVFVATRELVPDDEFASFQAFDSRLMASPNIEQGALV
jgi:hypothetical protein